MGQTVVTPLNVGNAVFEIARFKQDTSPSINLLTATDEPF